MNKLLFPPSTATVRPAARTLLLAFGLAFCFGLSGCRSSGPDPTAFNTPPTDAYALSGGKITHFTPMPGLPSDPSNKQLLTAFKLSHLSGSAARSGFMAFQSRTGSNIVSCLVVNNNVLIVLEDFTRQAFGWGSFSAGVGSREIVQGPPYNGKPFIETQQGRLFLYQNSQQYIQLTPNIGTALVGGKPIQLNHPVLWQDGKHPLSGDHVILLSDLLRLWQEHDKQAGSGASIRNVKIIYDMRDYHR